MAKQPQQNKWTPILILSGLCLAASFAIRNMNTFFGIYMPEEMLGNITSPLSLVFFVLAIVLISNRRSMNGNLLTRTLLMALATSLFIVGWRFCAGPPDGSGNDGYTVTGGFMMLASGLTVGSLAIQNKVKK